MSQTVSQGTKINSLHGALEFLSAAATTGAESIKHITDDYKTLQKLIQDAFPQVQGVVSDAKRQVVSTAGKSAKTVNKVLHQNAWKYVAFAAFASAIAGFFLARNLMSTFQEENFEFSH